jgi:uncharacterized membrane protein YraQ (UPF0718 family)
MNAKAVRQGAAGPAMGNGRFKSSAEAIPSRQRFQKLDIALSLAFVYAVSYSIWDTIRVAMAFAVFGMRLLEIVFFTGVAGSVIVVVISFVEDFQELFDK